MEKSIISKREWVYVWITNPYNKHEFNRQELLILFISQLLGIRKVFRKYSESWKDNQLVSFYNIFKVRNILFFFFTLSILSHTQHPENQFYSIHQYKNSMCKAIIETGLNSSIQLALSSKTLCISNFEMLQRGIWQLLTSFIASIKFNWNSSEILTPTFLEDWIQNNLEMKVIYNMRSTGKFCPLQILSRSC